MKYLLYHETHVKTPNKEWLLLVHGAGGSTRTWKRQIQELGDHYNLLVVDLPGHGQNAGKDINLPAYSFEIIADKIWEVVDHLKIHNIHLIGISLGTIICLQMRQLRPERVQSVIMPGAIVRLNRPLRILANISLSLAKIIGYRKFYNLSAFIMMPRGNHKQSRDIFIKESKALSISEFKKWTHLYYNLNETLDKLFHASFATSHFLIMGSQDHLFLPHAKAFSQHHETASIEIIKGCGHVVSIERATQFNKICLAFLRTVIRQEQIKAGVTNYKSLPH